jgi:NAD(P)H-flavin reductase/ferredoxin
MPRVVSPRVVFQGSSYEVDGESVLDCLTARGHAVPNSCRVGVCQSCLMRAVRGTVPEKAQTGLTPTMTARGLFLACQCFPTEDLEVALADDVIQRIEAKVSAIERLNDEIRAVRLRLSSPFEYRAGQFLRLFKDARTSRNYSLASVPSLDDDLMLHVRRFSGGLVSGWIFEHLEPGDIVTISEPFGDCFYVPGRPDQDILLLGTGCGLAPLYGITRDALNSGHRGRIHLYHGSGDASGLYLVEQLRQIAATHPNFRYRPCVSGGPSADGHWSGTPLDLALKDNPDLTGWRVYLCGNPQMVSAARMESFLAGAASSEIFADPFLPTGNPPTQGTNAL